MLIEIKGHRHLFRRCALIANLEIKDTVPNSLRTSDGALHPGHNNKHVEKLTDTYTRNTVVDEIVVFMSWSSSKGYLTIKISLKGLVNRYEEVRVVFDNYDDVSLKDHTRNRRGKTNHSQKFVIIDIGIHQRYQKEAQYISQINVTHFLISSRFLFCFRQQHYIWKYRCTIESQPRRARHVYNV